MNKLKLAVADGRLAFRPREEIEVVAQWQLDEQPTAVEVRLVWYTHGKGAGDSGVVRRDRFDMPAMSETRRCKLQLPKAPYSFSGKLISLIWVLELIVEPGEQTERIDITIAPRGEEIILHKDAATT
jgi:hypothetical protein